MPGAVAHLRVGRRLLSLAAAAAVGAGVASAGAWAGADGGLPPVPPDAADRPLVAAPVTTERGPHAFLVLGPRGEPVRWDPCRPIRVAVRAQGAPPGGDVLVAEVLAEVGAAAGLSFVVEGPTDEAPAPGRPALQPDRYGQRWAPVLLAWSDPAEYPALAGDTVGVAGPLAVDPRGDGRPRFVSGTVVLEASWFAEAVGHPQGRRRAAAVLKHELGHLVGLDHVDDPMQLMSPVYQSVLDWSAGDAEGLAALGRGPCHRDT